MPRKQSPADRLQRLTKGRCPIHGQPLQDATSGYNYVSKLSNWRNDWRATRPLDFGSTPSALARCEPYLADLKAEADENSAFTVVVCPQFDCWIAAKAYSCSGPWELLPRFLPLLHPRREG
jgi:hypothetical protein